jgi:hypothetical protein
VLLRLRNPLPAALVTGGALSLLAGAVAASSHGTTLAAGLIGIFLFAGAVVLFRRDPVLALLGLWVFEVFNAPLSASVGYFSAAGEAIRQGNEVLVLLFVVLVVWHLLRTSTKPPPAVLVLPALGYAVFGLASGLLHDVPTKVLLLGAWLGLKLWIVLAATLVLPWGRRDLERIYRLLTGIGLIVGGLGLVDYFTHGAVSRSLHTSIDYVEAGGYRSQAAQSILASPGEYSLFMSLLFGLSVARLSTSVNRRDLILSLLFAASVILSLRLKGVLSLGAVVLIVVAVQGARSGRSAAIGLAVGVALFGGVFVVERNVITKQVATYASTQTSARARLYGTSERIAAREFPFGAGFGRFATYPSRIYYSPVYAQYDLNAVWGLSKEYPKFIDDTSWPGVIGEAGYGGLAMYGLGLLALVVLLLGAVRRQPPERRWMALAALCAVGVFLVDSLGDPTLFNWLAVTTFAMLVAPGLLVAGRSPDPASERS